MRPKTFMAICLITYIPFQDRQQQKKRHCTWLVISEQEDKDWSQKGICFAIFLQTGNGTHILNTAGNLDGGKHRVHKEQGLWHCNRPESNCIQSHGHVKHGNRRKVKWDNENYQLLNCEILCPNILLILFSINSSRSLPALASSTWSLSHCSNSSALIFLTTWIVTFFPRYTSVCFSKTSDL